MSTSNRVGRNPFDKGNKASKAVIVEKTLANEKSEKVLKTSNKKAEKASPAVPTIQEAASKDSLKEEQIIGELIDLPEDHWQPLTAVPAGFIKQLFARWL